jgi:hypothetical protein
MAFGEFIDESVSISSACRKKFQEILHNLSDNVKLKSCGPDTVWQWDFWNAVFFSLSIVTTIGYGNMSCKTVEGRVATIFYALLGIPLMLFLLNTIGQVMFSSIEVLWKRARQ